MVTLFPSTIHTRIWFFEYTTRLPVPDRYGTPVYGGAVIAVVVGSSLGGGGNVGVSWMLLPRVAGAGASADASHAVAIGTSTGASGPRVVVVEGSVVVDDVVATTLDDQAALTQSTSTATTGAATPTLDLTVRRLLGRL